MFELQGLGSADPEMRAFCVVALLACEAFVHPRSQSPWPAAASAAPAATGPAVPSTSYLGVPRMWSAISPIPVPTGVQDLIMPYLMSLLIYDDLSS